MMQFDNFNSEIRVGVHQFNELINLQLKSIGEVIVEGEVTELNVTSRGGINIVLKDKHEQAIVSISGYAPRVEGINLIDIGMEVAIWGVPQLYSPYGKFSISINKILPLGDGALAKAFEILKTKLEKEGLFDIERKRELPELVTKIALITAKNSAAQTDFLKILKENKNALEIDFYPVAVQGAYATKEVKAALKIAQTKDYDCIVITRGGGSLEDLSAFNDESVSRAIFSSKIPTLVAIGHERDTSIAELVADIRASTPSQAAYYFVANTTKLVNNIELLADQIYLSLEKHISSIAREVSVDSLYHTISSVLREHQARLYRFGSDFESKILYKLNNYQYISSKADNYLNTFEKHIEEMTTKVSYYDRLFQSLNPSNVIKRGYAIIRDEKQGILTSVKQVKIGEKLNIELKNGKIRSTIDKIYNN